MTNKGDFWDPKCGSSAPNSSKICDFQVCVLAPVWGSAFGSIHGGRYHELVVSKTVYKETKEIYSFSTLEPIRVKGKAKKVPIFLVKD